MSDLARPSNTPVAANDTTAIDAGVRDWTWFDAQSAITKAEAERRLSVLVEVEAAVAAGAGKTAATAAVARRHGSSPRAVAAWFAAVRGAPWTDRLPRLAPQYRGGRKEAEIDAEAWRILKADYLRPGKPSFAACYKRLLANYATPRSVALPSAKTLHRRLNREHREALKTVSVQSEGGR